MVSRLLTTALIVIVHGTVLHAQVERLGRVFGVRSLFEDRGIRELVMEDPYLRLPDHGLGLQLDRDQDGDEDSGQWDEERLAALIQRTIAPDSWRNTRNSIEARDGHIAVVQTPDVLEQVDSLIALIEAREARTFSIDLAMVPPESMATLLPFISPTNAGFTSAGYVRSVFQSRCPAGESFTRPAWSLPPKVGRPGTTPLSIRYTFPAASTAEKLHSIRNDQRCTPAALSLIA